MKQLPPNLLNVLIAVISLIVFFIRVTISWDQSCMLEPSARILSCIFKPFGIQSGHAVRVLSAIHCLYRNLLRYDIQLRSQHHTNLIGIVIGLTLAKLSTPPSPSPPASPYQSHGCCHWSASGQIEDCHPRHRPGGNQRSQHLGQRCHQPITSLVLTKLMAKPN